VPSLLKAAKVAPQQRNVSRLSAVRYFAAQLSPSATQSVYSSRVYKDARGSTDHSRVSTQAK